MNTLICVSGGPAPGINTVISAAVIAGEQQGMKMFGAYEGFSGVCNNNDSIKPLHSKEISYIYNHSGSILGTARYNPLNSSSSQQKLNEQLEKHIITSLIVIGGEGSAMVSLLLSRAFPELSIVHVPKTIDNDIPLPNGMSTFGFESARSQGTEIIDTLRIDAKTCRRWYIVETMGRAAGFLTLGLMLASGASAAFIPEEFSDRLYTPEEVADRLVPIMKARAERGKPYGVALFAEGILDRLDLSGTKVADELIRDDLGRLTYSEVELGEVLLPCINKGLAEQDLSLPMKHTSLGYEMRCAPVVGSDIEYARLLGYGAIQAIKQQQRANLVCVVEGMLQFVPLEELATEDRITPRTVQLNSDTYQLAQKTMIR